VLYLLLNLFCFIISIHCKNYFCLTNYFFFHFIYLFFVDETQSKQLRYHLRNKDSINSRRRQRYNMKKTGLVEDFTEHEESKCLRSCFRSQIDMMNENQARFFMRIRHYQHGSKTTR